MKRALVVCAVLALLAPAAGADVPETMSYQSVLLDAGGVPVPDDDYSLTFKIYTTPAGPGPLWAETQVVPVEDGIFYVILGDVVALDILFDVPYWLGIQIGAEDELTPRLELTSTPYAHRAKYADTGAPDDDWVIAGDDIYHIDGSVGIGASPPFRRMPEAAELEGKEGDIPARAGDRGVNKLYVEGENQQVLYSKLTETDELSDGRAAVFAERLGSNPGSGHTVTGANNAITGLNSSPDQQTFGVAGFTSSASTRTAGVMGSVDDGWAWGALGHVDAAGNRWGVYGTSAYFQSHFQYKSNYAEPGLVLTCMDDYGTAEWTAAAGGIGGSGTTNFIPKFTGPTTLGNSIMADLGDLGGGIFIDGSLSVSTAAFPIAGHFSSQDATTYGAGVYGVVDSPIAVDTPGVKGYSKPEDGWGYGGYFEGGYGGVVGISMGGAASVPIKGVFGYSQSSNGAGLSFGVFGIADGAGANYGIYGKAEDGYQNFAGYFMGDVELTGTLTKGAGAFKIDHPLDPENMYLSHSFVESPDMMNVYNGNEVLDGNGEAVVVLPEWFEVLNRDFRYQLTCIGGFAPVYVAEEVSGGEFRISGGEAGMKISWQVTGIRQDRYAEEHRIQVEELKSPQDAGKYLHPKLYGAPKTQAVGYMEERPMQIGDRASHTVRKTQFEERERTDSE